MSKKSFLVAAMLILSACQAGSGPGNLAGPIPSPSSTPLVIPTAVSSPVPTAVPIDGQSIPPVFSMSRATFCFGQETTISLERSNLNRGSVGILMQIKPDVSQVPDTEIKPKPDIPTDPVVLGQLAVSPLGTGQLKFILQPTYVTRNGARVSLQAGDSVSLYAETGPGIYVRINDVKVCPPTASPIPGQLPTPLPSIPSNPTPAPIVDVVDTSFQTQQLHAFSDNQIGYEFSANLHGQNGFVFWRDPNSSEPGKLAGGRIIRNLTMGEGLASSAFPDVTSIDAYFNAAGNGIFSWSASNRHFLTPMKNLLPDGSPQRFDEGVRHAAFDETGQGDLYVVRSTEPNSWPLWRFPLVGFRPLVDQPQRVTMLPYFPRHIVLDEQGSGFVQTSKDLYSWPETPFENRELRLDQHQLTENRILAAKSRPELTRFPEGQGALLFEELPGLSDEPLKWTAYPVKGFKLEDPKTMAFPRSEGRPAVIEVNPDGNGLYAKTVLGGLMIRRLRNFQPDGPFYRLAKWNPDVSVSVKLELDSRGDGLLVWHQREPDPGSTQSSHNAGRLFMRPVRNYQSW